MTNPAIHRFRTAALALLIALVPKGGTAKQAVGAALFDTTLIKLFSIHRSTNENELVYEVRYKPDGFNVENPIYAYWIMKTEGGKIEPLTGLERAWAYGVSMKSATPDEIVFSLIALPDRTISVQRVGDTVRPVMQINGEECDVTEIFIQTKGRGLIPAVDYVDVSGKSRTTGNVVVERIGEESK